MKLLFDTHAFIWWDSDPAKLPSAVLAACRSSENTLLLSVVSVWEIQIKTQLGKLELKLPLADIVDQQQRTNNIEILPIMVDPVLALNDLPLYHKDPFDRLLIAQAQVENAALVSSDSAFTPYPVQLFWS